jgi:hypothetical protein
LFILLVSGYYRLDVSLFEKIQDYEEKTLSSSKRESRQVFLAHIDPICSPSSYTFACINWIIYTLYTNRIGFVVSRFAWPCSHECFTGLSILYDVEFGLCLCESVWSPISRDVI